MSTSHPPARRAHGPHGRGRPRAGRGAPHARSAAQHSAIAPLHPTETPPDIHSFAEWNLGDEVQSAIAAMQISVPTPIQKLAIGAVLEGRDVIAKAETGTGKTLAFGAPMMAKIDPARASVLGLVLCPTRELAEQVCKVLALLGAPRKIKVALIVGGEPLEPQVTALKGGAQVVVGTPGRILDLYKQRFLSFPWTEFTILDEADVMLEIGFIDDVKMILSFTPDERQTLLFSATFPPELLKLAREYTKNPVEVATASGVSTVDTIEQVFMKVDDDDRPLALIRMIEQSDKDDVFLVFCDRRTEVDKLMRRLERMPWPVKALHGGYDQEARFRVMTAFRSREVKALVATDVASRGLDVAHVTHVVNYGAPRDITDYTHRIGRTGRAGRKGRAITLVTPLGMRRWRGIIQDANWKIDEVDLPGSTREQSRRRDEPRRAARAARREPELEQPVTEPGQPVTGRERSGPERERSSSGRQRFGSGRERPHPDRHPQDARRGPPESGRGRGRAPGRDERPRWPVDHSEERTGSISARPWSAAADDAPGSRAGAPSEPGRPARDERRPHDDSRARSQGVPVSDRPPRRGAPPRLRETERPRNEPAQPQHDARRPAREADRPRREEQRREEQRREEPRRDEPRRAEPRHESARRESPRHTAPQREAAQPETSRAEGPRPESPHRSAPPREPRRPESARPEGLAAPRERTTRERPSDDRPSPRSRPEPRPRGPRSPSDRPDFGTGL